MIIVQKRINKKIYNLSFCNMDLIHSQKRALVFFFLVLFLFVENESFSLTVQQNSGQGKEDTSGNSQAKQSNDEIEKMLLKRMKEDQGKMELSKKSLSGCKSKLIRTRCSL
ncbi:hypothetical protein OU792_18640 [Algoriphagus sp. NF]|uniref:hypothetical protein n=1 Tax=Algoriphagus sp. NF TaxID=2992756 RepID=UPI001065E749|nr:hypothetical protein [Algoriphagus sp. NF]MDE0562020.1 hypothetical protein [Algoriphagus sp. NF]